MVERLFNTKIK